MSRTKIPLNKDLKEEERGKEHEELAQSIAYDEHIVILSLFLPIKLTIDLNSNYEVSFLYEDPLSEIQSFLFTRLSIHYKRLLWIGLLKDCTVKDPIIRSKIQEFLLVNYRCKVLWDIDYEPSYTLWQGVFGKSTPLDPLIGKLSQNKGFLQLEACFIKAISEVIEENTMAVILDGFLGFISTALAGKGIKIALYSHYGLPSYENLFLLKDPLKVVYQFLSPQVLALNDYKETRRLQSLLQSFNLPISLISERGSLILKGFNNRVFIKPGFPGLDLSHLETHIKKIKGFERIYQQTGTEVNGMRGVLCLEDLLAYKGVEQRLLFLQRFLVETGNKFHLRVFFLLKVNTNLDFQDELYNIKELINTINNTVFINPFHTDPEDFTTIRLVEAPSFPKEDIAAYMSQCSLFLASENSLQEVLEFLAISEQNGVCLSSKEFEACGLLQGFVSYQPYKYESFREKLKQLLGTDPQILAYISACDKSFLRKNSLLSWFEGIILDLKRCSVNKGINIGGEIDDGKALEREILMKAYRNGRNRLFVMEIGGNLKELLKTLELLCKDRRNSFYLISDDSPKDFEVNLLDIKGLGLLAENGFFYRDPVKPKWKKIMPLNHNWKDNILPIMRGFLERTEASFIVEKESFVIWNYRGCDQELGDKQAKELEGLLKEEIKDELGDLEVFI